MQTVRGAWRAVGRPWPRGERSSRRRRGRAPWLSSPGVVAVLKGRNHNTTPALRPTVRTRTATKENVDGCPEALLPGALTRRLSACRLRLTLPPSLPPSPPSYPRLASSSGSSPCAFSLARRFATILSQRSRPAHLCLYFPVTITHDRTFDLNIQAATWVVKSWYHGTCSSIRIILSRTHFASPLCSATLRDEITTVVLDSAQ